MTDKLLTHDHHAIDAVLAEAFSYVDAGDVEQAFLALDQLWAYLAVHIRSENTILFPTLLRASERPPSPAEAPSLTEIRTAITQLRHDHDFFMAELTPAVKALRELRRGQRQDVSVVMVDVRKKLTRVRQRLGTHNAYEETKVYRWAGVLLEKEEQSALNERIQQDLMNPPSRWSNP